MVFQYFIRFLLSVSFSSLGLNERLVRALDEQDIKTPTPVQQALIPPALTGKDVMGSAETGSGKTIAFMMPILQRLMDNPKPRTNTRALIVLPTRELAQQISRTCETLSTYTRVTSDLITGGSGFQEQQARLRKNPEIVIGTPGRLLEHVQKGSLLLNDVEVLVLDEADRMLDMGFRDDVTEITSACTSDHQTLLLSATLQHEGLRKIAGDLLNAPEVISMGTHRQQHQHIEQQYILADDNAHKRQLLVWLLANTEFEKVLVFTNTRDYCDELREFLFSQQVRVAGLHGEMPHPERKKVMQRFRNDSIPVLVATDLAARGLDIDGVDLVVNFHLARSGDDFLHRTGRTGRAGKQGKAISLVSPQEWNLMQSICRYLSLEPEQIAVDGMKARFKGEMKKGKGKKKEDGKSRKKNPADKSKERHRNKKNVGKRRVKGDLQKTGSGATSDSSEKKPAKKKQSDSAKPKKSDTAKPRKSNTARPKKSSIAKPTGFEPLTRKKKDD